jgi:hypothetical protein
MGWFLEKKKKEWEQKPLNWFFCIKQQSLKI